MDAIDACVVGNLESDPKAAALKARQGIKLVDFKPFNPVDKRTEITYIEDSTGNMKRVTKGMTVRSTLPADGDEADERTGHHHRALLAQQD